MPRKRSESKAENENQNESKELIEDSQNRKSLGKRDKNQIDKDHQKELKKQQLEEKQRQKMEEKMKKEQDKKLKEEEKKRKEIDRELERRKKEMEKEEEKRKKELEKKQKEIEKDEEKRRKEEERRLKENEREEEKRRKEEERKKKEEEKRKEEDERNRKLERQRAILLGFLHKDKNDLDSQENLTCDLQNICGFKPIEAKKDMRISSIERIKKKQIHSLSDLTNTEQTYLMELNEQKAGNGICDRTWILPDPEVEIMTSKRLKTKTLLFVENIRPPYCGTWRKKSDFITPLNPLAEDKSFFDYELDSDQEWECESGEDIASSDNEEDEEINEEPEDISFVVPHGYLSDGEDVIDVDPGEEICTPIKKKRLTNETMQMLIDIREKQFQAEVNQQVHQINPNIIGPYFVTNDKIQSTPTSNDLFRMVCRTGDGFPINCNLQSDLDYSTNSSKIKSVPAEAVVHLIRLVHCNQMSRAKLCYEFRMFWEYSLSKKLPDVTFENDLQGKDWDEFSIGKKRFFEKLKEIAEWKDGMWIVKPEVIQEYQLCCLDDDPGKPCTEKWKYVSEVINVESKKIPKKRKGAADTAAPVNKKVKKNDNDTRPMLK